MLEIFKLYFKVLNRDFGFEQKVTHIAELKVTHIAKQKKEGSLQTMGHFFKRGSLHFKLSYFGAFQKVMHSIAKKKKGRLKLNFLLYFS